MSFNVHKINIFRKHCTNCRCGKADHNVLVNERVGADVGFYFVGRLFDRPMRTKKEELEFCYGNALEDQVYSSPSGILVRNKGSTSRKKQPTNGKKVKFDWLPQNVSDRLTLLYLNQMPKSALAIAGTQGAQFRQQHQCSNKVTTL